MRYQSRLMIVAVFLFSVLGVQAQNATNYREDDWDKLMTDGAKVRPYRTERYNLNSLLLRRVIVNKPDRP